MLRVAVLIVFTLCSPLIAGEMTTHKDIAYAEPKTEPQRNMLDVYTASNSGKRPIIFYIHGGGWTKGEKHGVDKKPQAFVDKGFVFVSTNYRFVPNVTVKEMMGDIAKAIRWTHDHAAEYGGDGDAIVVMGHSAGAHLAALICTDDSYLKAEGLSLAILKGCVPIDVSVYDIAKRSESMRSRPKGMYKDVFTDDPKIYNDLSPVTHIASGKSIPPFLILYVADREETKVQSYWLAEKLGEVGIASTVFAGEGKTHGTICSDLGTDDDKPTEAVYGFLAGLGLGA
ncbi:MAG TPA: alpha/beta hydrolase [Pirellulales bacterium]|jgi:acetyl esterase/lipase|nr:alpha/beta hydrolase [Pirellulales bacterium]